MFDRIEYEIAISPIDIEITIKEQPSHYWGFCGITGDEAKLHYKVNVSQVVQKGREKASRLLTQTFGAYMRVLAIILYFAAAIWSQTSFADALEEFGNQMSYFYLSPSQDKFNAIQRNADNLRGKLEESQNGADILVAVMVAKISKKHQWPIINSAFGLRAKEIMDGKSSLAKYVLDDSQVDPTKLDVWWASFFAVGEEKYLDNIFQYAGLELPKGDLGKMLVIGAASWSFKANCKQHQKVLEFARQKLRSPSISEVQKIFIKECIAFAEGKGTEQGAPGDAREAAHP